MDKPDCLENGGRQTVPSKLEVVVVGWGWTSVGLRRWYWGQFVEVEHDVEVLELEVDLREERGEEHCNIHAIGGRESRGVRSWPWHSRGEPPMGRWRSHRGSVQGSASACDLYDWFPQSIVQRDGPSMGK